MSKISKGVRSICVLKSVRNILGSVIIFKKRKPNEKPKIVKMKMNGFYDWKTKPKTNWSLIFLII